MERRNFIKTLAVSGAAGLTGNTLQAATTQKKKTAQKVTANDREYWSDLLYKIASPVLSNMAKGELQKNMTVELSPTWDGRDKAVTYMECFGRLIAGVAPWLTLPEDNTDEGKKRKQLRDWALQSYAHSVDPSSPDYLLWRKEGQPLVDSAYFTNALIRAPKQLWEPLDNTTKQRIITEIKLLRRVKPPYTNWLLFAAMNEAFLLMVDEDYDPMRIDLTLQKLNEWYVGDGWYSDGTKFHFDYYNSFVIHPMLVEILEVLVEKNTIRKDVYEQALKRMKRFSEHLERFVSPEGTFPPFGRSLTYRTGAFQPLALLAWKKQLSEIHTEGQIRSALTAVHKSIFVAQSNFTSDGYLTIGFAGHQPELGDWYSNNGSMYLTSTSFLPLGLPEKDSFWTSPEEAWTSKKAFKSELFKKDYPVEY
ncbi:MAG: DUF2264 domain-containing protein [Tannerella sp.]|jgi:hypothetical protein|nr:DUF2264 domain-containing protein [Tannerella sp.]